MPLASLAGHHEARRRLAHAEAADRLPQVLLFTGPEGVGKQRLALWLAQLVVCEAPGAEPCGRCRPCGLVLGLRHPDLHWLIPIPRPRAGDPGKQIEEAAETLAATIEERRTRPLYGRPDGMASHGIASVRLLQRAAGLTAVEAKRRVFIIGDAERLVPQESSPEAANAVLKLLEEPPSRSLFVLTTVDARRLLPTVRSRAVPLRLHRLADADVRDFLRSELGLKGPELERRVTAAAGAIGAAAGEGDEGGLPYRAAEALLEALLGGPAGRMQRALAQGPFAARGEFTSLLDAVQEVLADAARAALGEAPRREVPAPLAGRDPGGLVRAMELVSEARDSAQGNVNPQLLLAVLGEDLAETL